MQLMITKTLFFKGWQKFCWCQPNNCQW